MLFKFFSLLLVIITYQTTEGKIGKFLQYDIECPFLNDEEYAKRMIKSRCPFTTPTPPRFLLFEL